MHELALAITETRSKHQWGDIVRPAGHVGIVMSEVVKKDRWLQLICNIASPNHRNHDQIINGLIKNCNWTKQNTVDLCNHWSEHLYEEWRECMRIKVGQNVNDMINGFWEKIVPDSGLKSILGKDPLGIVSKIESWQWSNQELTKTFVISISDIDESTARSLTGQVATIDDDVLTSKNEIKHIVIDRNVYDFERKLEFSEDTISKIKNEETKINVRYDKPINSNLRTIYSGVPMNIR